MFTALGSDLNRPYYRPPFRQEHLSGIKPWNIFRNGQPVMVNFVCEDKTIISDYSTLLEGSSVRIPEDFQTIYTCYDLSWVLTRLKSVSINPTDQYTLLRTCLGLPKQFVDSIESWSVALVSKKGEMVIRDAHGGVLNRHGGSFDLRYVNQKRFVCKDPVPVWCCRPKPVSHTGVLSDLIKRIQLLN